MRKLNKWIIIGLAGLLIVSFVIILIYFIGNKTAIENSSIKNQTSDQDYNDKDINSSDEKDEEEENNPALELLYSGKMEGVEFGIGTNSNKIMEQWGEPDYKENFMGGLLLSYDDVYFFTDGYILDDSITDGEVTGIYYTGDETVYGVHIGMPLEQVEEILGDPNNTYTSHYSELRADNNIILNYMAGEYKVDFESDESEMIQSISIWKNEKEME